MIWCYNCTYSNSSSDTLEVCPANAGPHDIVMRSENNENENSMYAGPAKAITGSVLNKSQEEFRNS